MMGIGPNENILYLIDFGLAKKYRAYRVKVLNGVKELKKIAGTPRFASINALKGVGKK